VAKTMKPNNQLILSSVLKTSVLIMTITAAHMHRYTICKHIFLTNFAFSLTSFENMSIDQQLWKLGPI
jgi:hypothetical protein